MASGGMFPSPRDVSGLRYPFVLGPIVLREAAWTKGRTGRKISVVYVGAKPILQEYGIRY